MDFIKKIWRNFRAQPDVWFFYGFLITFTFSIRKVLFFYPIGDQFNEYSGIYLYLSDIFLILTIILLVISILKNKSDTLSTPLETNSVKNKIKLNKIFLTGSSCKSFLAQNKFLIIIPLILVLWSFISITWSDNNNIALFKSIKLLEFYLLYLYLIFKIVPRETLLKNIFRIFMFFGLFQAIIGIWQFIIQKSIGFFWLKESLISPEILGVAKVILGGEKFVRSYGLFPHPNILGGFLLFSIISTFAYFRCHSERSPELFGTKSKNLIIRSLGKLGMTIITIQFIALLLTFSKSAILGLTIALLYIFVLYWKNCSTPVGMFHMEHPTGQAWNKFVFFGAEHRKKFILIVAILALVVIIIRPDTSSLLFKSLDERVLYAGVSYETISAHPLIGLGSGQFVSNMDKFVPSQKECPTCSTWNILRDRRGTNLEFWQYQPVHNVFLLIWSELGIIGLTLFLWFLWLIFRIKTNIGYYNLTIMLKSVIIGFIFIMLFDHYFWDIQQGQILFWMIAGLIAGVSFNEKTDLKN